MPSLNVVCPAATVLAGPDPLGPTSICGVLVNDRDKEGQFEEREENAAVTFTTGLDGPTVYTSCCDRYQTCEIWIAEKDRIREERWRLEPDESLENREQIDQQRRAARWA